MARAKSPPRAWQRMLSGRRLDLLDPARLILSTIGVPLGANKPYASLAAPISPALRNVDFFEQAVVVHQGGATEMTNVGKFRF